MAAIAGSDLLPHLDFPVLQHEAGYQLAFVGQQISASHLSLPAQPPLFAGKSCLELVGERSHPKMWLSHVSPSAAQGRKTDLRTKLLLTLLSGSELDNGSHLLWVCLRHVASEWTILCGNSTTFVSKEADHCLRMCHAANRSSKCCFTSVL